MKQRLHYHAAARRWVIAPKLVEVSPTGLNDRQVRALRRAGRVREINAMTIEVIDATET